jgi:uncharacterized membrane protein YbhN (UPF0104 family)
MFALFRTSAVIAGAARFVRRLIKLAPLENLQFRIDRGAVEVGAWYQAHLQRWNSFGTAGWGIASWLSATFAVGSAMAAAGLQVTPEKAAFVLFVLNVAGAMSVLTFAGLGFVEFGLAGTLMIFGINWQQAMATAVAVRMLLLCFNLLVPALLIAIAVPGKVTSVLTRPRS